MVVVCACCCFVWLRWVGFVLLGFVIDMLPWLVICAVLRLVVTSGELSVLWCF